MLPFPLVFHPRFTVDLGPHVFPAQKYRLVRERLLATHIAAESDFREPAPASLEDVLRVHTPDYVGKLSAGSFTTPEARTLEVPWSKALVDAFYLAAGGTLLSARLARQSRCAILIGGGFHHAFADHGEGFCLLNDVAIAVRALQASGEAARLAVLDLDVHHGNGTSAILGADPGVFTASLHQEHNYPGVKPKSSLDVGLEDGTGDAAYLAALAGPLERCLAFRPDVLFYLAGADPYEHDVLGGLGLTKAGLRARDRRVFVAAKDAGVPVAVTLAGGYAAQPADTVEIHAATVEVAAEVFA